MFTVYTNCNYDVNVIFSQYAHNILIKKGVKIWEKWELRNDSCSTKYNILGINVDKRHKRVYWSEKYMGKRAYTQDIYSIRYNILSVYSRCNNLYIPIGRWNKNEI